MTHLLTAIALAIGTLPAFAETTPSTWNHVATGDPSGVENRGTQEHGFGTCGTGIAGAVGKK